MAGPARVNTGPAKPPGIDELLLPGVPANVRPGGRIKVEAVTNDMFNIAERLAEINPRLAVNITENQVTGEKAYTIVEEVPGYGPQVVFRCNVLDARVLEHVRYLLNVPFEKRFAEAEKIADKHEADSHEHELDELTERIGLPMVRDLMECGFIDNRGGFQHLPKKFGRG